MIMTIETLAYIIGTARDKSDERGEQTDDICVTLNYKTFGDLRYTLCASMLFVPVTPHTFEYMGALVSWSPAHEADPDSHSVGKIWPRR